MTRLNTLNLSIWHKSLIICAVPAVLAAAGCSKKASDNGMPSASVTDLSAPAPAPMAAYSAAPAPVYDTTPVAPASYATNTSGTMGSGSTGNEMGGTYKVKKGDTLFGIARARYGDGKQWQKIAAANPGLSPQSLKVGQTITVP